MVRGEQRQHINLSQHAWSVIESDMAAFDLSSSISGFLNEIVINFIEDSRASISIAKYKKFQDLEASYLASRSKLKQSRKARGTTSRGRTGELSSEEHRILDRLAENYALELSEAMNSFPKGSAVKIRLRNEVYDLIHFSNGDDWCESDYYQSAGAYLKAIIEDYASQSFYQREAILYKDILAQIESELELPPEQRRIIRIEQTFRGETKIFDVKAFKLLPDSNTNYHYLVCLSKRAEEPGLPNRITSFRISRISKVKPRARSLGSGKIPATREKEIERAIASKGVQYLVGDSVEIKVRMTKKGFGMYQSILHMRPPVVSPPIVSDDSILLIFNCTELQIKNYFFRFGPDAVVVSPERLKVDFLSEYKNALEAYSL